MLILAKLLRQSLWRGTLLSHKDEEELRNAFLHKYPLNNDALDNLLCSFLHFYSSRTGTWSVSLNENDLMKRINNKGKKSFDTCSLWSCQESDDKKCFISHTKGDSGLWQSTLWRFFWWVERAGHADTFWVSLLVICLTKGLIVAVQIS